MKKKIESARFIKDCIAQSLIKLSKEKAYEEITVKEICETAGVGRTTYYRYFSNKDGKNKSLVEYTISKWKEYCVGKEKQVAEDEGRVFFDFIYESKDHFIWLHDNQLNNIIFDVFYTTIGPGAEEESHIAFFKSFMAGGVYGVVYNWIQNGFQETPDQIRKKFEQMKMNEIN